MNIKDLLIQIAGFLTLIDRGIIKVPHYTQDEAHQLLNKIGQAINELSE